MIELRPVTADEMILAFLQADSETPTHRRDLYARALMRISANRATLIGDLADLKNSRQNDIRRWVLGAVRGYGRDVGLFQGFPGDTNWRLVKVIPDEVKGFKYVNHQEGWARVSGSTRLVAEGVNNLDQDHNAEIKGNVSGIATRLGQGHKFPALIAVQCSNDTAQAVLMEGHTRATAYALTGLPGEIDVIIGSSPTMNRWVFF
jgi:hypothetical protein